MSHLQVVDTAKAGVIEKTDIDLPVFLHGGQQFGMEHNKRSVSHHCIYIPITDGMLDAQSTGNLIAHTGVAILHMIGIHGTGTPHPLHIPRQGAGCADNHIFRINGLIDYTQNGSLGQLGFQILGKAERRISVGIIDFRHIIRPESNTVQSVQFFLPAAAGFRHLGSIRSLVALQSL